MKNSIQFFFTTLAAVFGQDVISTCGTIKRTYKGGSCCGGSSADHPVNVSTICASNAFATFYDRSTRQMHTFQTKDDFDTQFIVEDRQSTPVVLRHAYVKGGDLTIFQDVDMGSTILVLEDSQFKGTTRLTRKPMFTGHIVLSEGSGLEHLTLKTHHTILQDRSFLLGGRHHQDLATMGLLYPVARSPGKERDNTGSIEDITTTLFFGVAVRVWQPTTNYMVGTSPKTVIRHVDFGTGDPMDRMQAAIVGESTDAYDILVDHCTANIHFDVTKYSVYFEPTTAFAGVSDEVTGVPFWQARGMRFNFRVDTMVNFFRTLGDDKFWQTRPDDYAYTFSGTGPKSLDTIGVFTMNNSEITYNVASLTTINLFHMDGMIERMAVHNSKVSLNVLESPFYNLQSQNGFLWNGFNSGKHHYLTPLYTGRFQQRGGGVLFASQLRTLGTITSKLVPNWFKSLPSVKDQVNSAGQTISDTPDFIEYNEAYYPYLRGGTYMREFHLSDSTFVHTIPPDSRVTAAGLLGAVGYMHTARFERVTLDVMGQGLTFQRTNHFTAIDSEFILRPVQDVETVSKYDISTNGVASLFSVASIQYDLATGELGKYHFQGCTFTVLVEGSTLDSWYDKFISTRFEAHEGSLVYEDTTFRLMGKGLDRDPTGHAMLNPVTPLKDFTMYWFGDNNPATSMDRTSGYSLVSAYGISGGNPQIYEWRDEEDDSPRVEYKNYLSGVLDRSTLANIFDLKYGPRSIPSPSVHADFHDCTMEYWDDDTLVTHGPVYVTLPRPEDAMSYTAVKTKNVTRASLPEKLTGNIVVPRYSWGYGRDHRYFEGELYTGDVHRRLHVRSEYLNAQMSNTDLIQAPFYLRFAVVDTNMDGVFETLLPNSEEDWDGDGLSDTIVPADFGIGSDLVMVHPGTIVGSIEYDGKEFALWFSNAGLSPCGDFEQSKTRLNFETVTLSNGKDVTGFLQYGVLHVNYDGARFHEMLFDQPIYHVDGTPSASGSSLVQDLPVRSKILVGNTNLEMTFPPSTTGRCANNTVINGNVIIDGTSQELTLKFTVAS